MKFIGRKKMVDVLNGVEITRQGSCVVKIAYADNTKVTLELARKITTELIRRYGKERLGLVHVAGRETTVEEGVREFLAGKSGAQNKIAEAFVVKNLNQRILGNFYLRVGRPACPTEVFTLEDEAVKWVKMYCPRQMDGQVIKNSEQNTGDGVHSSPVQNFGAN